MDRALAPPTHPRVSSGIPCFFDTVWINRSRRLGTPTASEKAIGDRRFQTGFSRKHASMSRRNESMIKARSHRKSGEPPFFSFPASLFILLFIKERCHGTTTLLFCGGAHFFAQFLQAFCSTTYLAQNPIGIGFSSLQPINFPFFLPIFFLQLDRKAIPKRPADPKPPEILRSRLPGLLSYFILVERAARATPPPPLSPPPRPTRRTL